MMDKLKKHGFLPTVADRFLYRSLVYKKTQEVQ